VAVLPEVVVSVELENGKKGHATREPSSPRQVPNTDAMQIDLIWRRFFYWIDNKRSVHLLTKKNREIERFLPSSSVNCILMLQCTLPHCAPTAYPASLPFPSLIHSNPVSSLIDSELKEWRCATSTPAGSRSGPSSRSAALA